MKKGKIALSVIGLVLGVVLTYVLVCCGITFIPMARMAAVNRSACGDAATPTATITLEGGATLYAFAAEAASDRYVIICPGGGYVSCQTVAEGYCIADQCNRLGYTAFVLQYHVGKAITAYRAPLDDLAQAVLYVDQHAADYGVSAGNYDLCGFSAGGNLVGLFGTTHCGYANYAGVQAPQTILMGYPWINPHLPPSYRGNVAQGVLASAFGDYKGNVADAFYYCNLTLQGANAFLGGIDDLSEMQVQHWVTPDYPRVYMMHGDNDKIVPVETASDLFAQVLEANGVSYRYNRCQDVGHGCGLGIGTAAEGWLAEALAFSAETE